ncbi:MAG: hypothetical protein ACFFCD_01560 [Promethearchaeota archaeon]
MRAVKREKNELEQCESFDTLTDLEVHKKYWEFVFSRVIEGVTEKVNNFVERAQRFIVSEISQKVQNILKDKVEKQKLD